MALTSGTRIGSYEIAGLIGAGGMGEVYRDRDTRLGRDVALKVLPAGVASNADRLARFEREARAVAALNHPNIVTLHSIEDEAGVRFLTMELVEGQGLDAHVALGGLPRWTMPLSWAAASASATAMPTSSTVEHPMDPGVVERIEALKASIPKATLDGLVAEAGTLTPAAVLAMVAE